jgi:hypothetical protein
MEARFIKGDRLRNIQGHIWEVTGVGRDRLYKCVCVDTGQLYSIGDVKEWNFYQDNVWEYLGNFGKSNNFKLIYDILNNEE